MPEDHDVEEPELLEGFHEAVYSTIHFSDFKLMEMQADLETTNDAIGETLQEIRIIRKEAEKARIAAEEARKASIMSIAVNVAAIISTIFTVLSVLLQIWTPKP